MVPLGRETERSTTKRSEALFGRERKNSFLEQWVRCAESGARGGIRTHKSFRTTDFKSVAKNFLFVVFSASYARDLGVFPVYGTTYGTTREVGSVRYDSHRLFHTQNSRSR